MGRDIAATAKDFEQHAQKGYLPENLAQELHSLSDTDRLAVAKQIDWDMKHQSNPSLPKVEFYDSGDLKSIEASGKSGTSDFTEHTELYKDSGKIKSELNTTNTKLSYEQSTDIELVERDSNRHMTHKYDLSTRVNGTKVTTTSDDDRWAYDAKSGKQISHDEQTSWGKKLHEEFDATTGKEKSADETNAKGTVHRTYDATTGNLKQENIVNSDKTHETLKYDSNGDKLSREKQYGNNGDKGTRIWTYSHKTGKENYTEWRDPSGRVEKNNIDEDGHYTRVQD
jgi:hypothetical protein